MIGSFETPAERARSDAAWAALVSGAMADDECPECAGEGFVPEHMDDAWIEPGLILSVAFDAHGFRSQPCDCCKGTGRTQEI